MTYTLVGAAYPFLAGDNYTQRSYSEFSSTNQHFEHFLGIFRFIGQIIRCWPQNIGFVF